ncbi:olfactory receptor 14J1-like [Tachyglossus aculeatus]|uniref:olfactory receptor 14J1-like n=1 Tax=Tachyglossus aculeatus TaxID=9261 RepID=UPI0018F51137|nr:olfactory receptor 14J1-like [Tachyglossus aculeatus]
MTNVTVKTQFLLLAFSEVRKLQLVQAALFVLLYMAPLTGNLLIVAFFCDVPSLLKITCSEKHNVIDATLPSESSLMLYLLVSVFYKVVPPGLNPLIYSLRNRDAKAATGRILNGSLTQTLLNLALSDLCYLSVTVPKSILNFLLNVNSIFLTACTAQFFLVICLAGTEMALLTVMSHDRIMAICQPLRYDTIIHRLACASMLAASWFSSGLNAALYTASAVSLSFCGPRAVQPCFCDGPQLLRLPCLSSQGAENLGLATTVSLPFFCFMLFVVSYVHIFWAVLRAAFCIPTSNDKSSESLSIIYYFSSC